MPTRKLHTDEVAEGYFVMVRLRDEYEQINFVEDFKRDFGREFRSDGEHIDKIMSLISETKTYKWWRIPVVIIHVVGEKLMRRIVKWVHDRGIPPPKTEWDKLFFRTIYPY